MMADTLKEIAYDELVSVILPYWMGRVVDLRHGGFFGRVDCYDRPCPDSDKAAILNARLVWAFSAAYRVLGDPILRSYADRACGYFREHFIDPQYGGVYFNLKCDGSVHEAGKHVYSNGFALYALSEYARATGDAGALEAALGVFHVLEERAWSAEDGGYLECFSRDWSTPLTRRRPGHMLSMNTHLHILEPYTNLYRVAPTSEVRAALGKLIGLFVNHIFDPATGHLIPWFEAGWKPVDRSFSYGHDIEASWLLKEAADVFDDPEISRLVDHVWQPLLRVALEGRRPDGGMVYERNPETGEYPVKGGRILLGNERLVLLFNETGKPKEVEFENLRLGRNSMAAVWENGKYEKIRGKMKLTIPPDDLAALFMVRRRLHCLFTRIT